MAPPENHVRLKGNFVIRDVRRLYAHLNNLIEFRGFENVIIDLSELSVCFPDTILPVISSVDLYRREGVRFSIIPPSEESLKKTFERANWLHLLAPNTYSPTRDDRPDHFPAHKFTSTQEQTTVVTEIIERILRTVTSLDRDHLRGLEWALNEITDNVLVHSGDGTPGFIQLAHKPRRNEIEFSVADSGSGIPSTLRSGLNKFWTDSEALEEAIKEGVTRGTGQGNGLFGSIRIAEASRGAFSINSGSAFLALDREGQVHTREEQDLFPGTAVDCTFSYAKPMVLENALSFRNLKHNPVGLYEEKYESDDQSLHFEITTEARSVGTREAGAEARTKIENLIKFSKPTSTIIDCRDAKTMSSSFADEFFVKLIQTAKSMTNIIILDANQTNMHLIMRSYKLREKNDTGGIESFFAKRKNTSKKS